jgi:hypothetical protein
MAFTPRKMPIKIIPHSIMVGMVTDEMLKA